MQLYAQQQRTTCQVAALRSVLATQFGIDIPEALLAYGGDIAYATIKDEGMGSRQLRDMLRVANRARNCMSARWRLRTWRHGKLWMLRRECEAGRLPMASVATKEGQSWRHCVVVLGVDATHVRYFDPADGRQHTKSRERWEAWWDEHGWRWMAVVKA